MTPNILAPNMQNATILDDYPMKNSGFLGPLKSYVALAT